MTDINQLVEQWPAGQDELLYKLNYKTPYYNSRGEVMGYHIDIHKLQADAESNAAKCELQERIIRELVASLRPFSVGKTMGITTDGLHAMVHVLSVMDITKALATAQSWLDKQGGE
jgi:hypothetical protein